MHVYMHMYVYICAYSYMFEWLPSISPTFIFPWPWGLADLIYVVEGGALIWPVSITLLDAVLHQWGQHDNDSAATLPHHLGTETPVSSILTSLGPGWPWLPTGPLVPGEALPPRAHLPEV